MPMRLNRLWNYCARTGSGPADTFYSRRVVQLFGLQRFGLQLFGLRLFGIWIAVEVDVGRLDLGLDVIEG